MAKNIGQKVSGGIEIDVTNEDLANSANITPTRSPQGQQLAAA
jgi:hypothetical protein